MYYNCIYNCKYKEPKQISTRHPGAVEVHLGGDVQGLQLRASHGVLLQGQSPTVVIILIVINGHINDTINKLSSSQKSPDVFVRLRFPSERQPRSCRSRKPLNNQRWKP